jgi:hypothetical protein
MVDQQSQIQLRTGRIIYLRELRQWGFYEGLIEGVPTTEMNRRRLEGIVAEYRGKSYGADPLLIPPVEKVIEWDRNSPYPFGNPAVVPSIVCAARFESLQPAHDLSKDFSGLLVIWFQNKFAFPIDPVVLDRLHATEWERLAVDDYY